MLKLPLSFALSSLVVVALDDVVALGEVALDDVVALDDAKPKLEKTWDNVWTASDYWTGPLNKPVVHKADTNDHLCHGTQSAPSNYNELQKNGYDYWCQFDDDETEERCCSNTHDLFLRKTELDGIFPEECIDGEYRFPGLYQLFCLVCDPKQPDYVDATQKIIRICESRLKQYYGADLDGVTEAYEDCGGWDDPDPILFATDLKDPTNGFEVLYPDPELVYPKGSYANGKEFYKEWEQAEIPFFEGFMIMSVPDEDADGNRNSNVCYRSAVFLSNFLPVVLAATALNFLV